MAAFRKFSTPRFTFIKDKKIVIYKSESINVNGSIKKVWQPLENKKLWACYQSLSTEKVLAASLVSFQASCYFIVNWREDIAPGFHILFRGKIYEIVGVDDFEGYKKDIKLTCKTGAGYNLANYPPVSEE